VGKSDRVLVINDAPDLKSRLDRWLMRRKVVYTLGDTDDEARERLDSESYDLVVYSSEFQDSAKLQSGW
jgi:DNA-binding NtrC family response regulator